MSPTQGLRGDLSHFQAGDGSVAVREAPGRSERLTAAIEAELEWMGPDARQAVEGVMRVIEEWDL